MTSSLALGAYRCYTDILLTTSKPKNADMTSQTHSSLLSSTWISFQDIGFQDIGLQDIGFQDIGFQDIGLQGHDTYAQAGFVMPIAGKPACERRNNNTQVVAT